MTAFLVLFGFGLLLTTLAVPLILRKVPMNHVYGVRLPKSFVSDDNWYEINAYGGKLLLALGIFLLAFSLVVRALWPAPSDTLTLILMIVPLPGLIPVLILITLFSSRLPGRGPTDEQSEAPQKAPKHTRAVDNAPAHC